jgi:hypothetical protein
MITNFQMPRPTEPETDNHLQWPAALGAGLIAGLVLLAVPRGSPWSTVTFFVPAIVGRIIPDTWNITLFVSILIHLGVSLLYGIIISMVVSGIREMRAVLTGGVIGLILYLANLGIISYFAPSLRGNEATVVFTHVVFGLIAGAAYRGLLRRRAATMADI